ncbi:hypothetical protein DB354_16745 [Opitutus sp. ER46]|nr:hypothetical protein DB354_16745 [Opitutus sp. ER46]
MVPFRPLLRAVALVFIAALVLSPAPLRAAAPAAVTLTLGDRTVTTRQFTADGIPVVPRWTAPLPPGNPPAPATWPLVRSAEHVTVWRPARRDEGGYNHYAALIHHAGQFYALWANHPLGEDAPGQRVLFAVSADGRRWTTPRELFAAPGPYRRAGEEGLALKPDRWVATPAGLYAVTYVHGTPVYPVARRVEPDGRLGPVFLLRPLPAGALRPRFAPDLAVAPAEAAAIRQYYVDHDLVSWWSHVAGEGVPARASDGAALMEPFSYRSVHGPVLCLRSAQGADTKPRQRNRLYVSFPTAEGGWSIPQPTNIPDAPSRAQALRLPDGRVVLVGNQIATRFDQAQHLRRDPLTLALSPDGETFDRVFALRAGAPGKHRWAGITGRGIGFSYPSALVHDGALFILYSVNKEEIALSRVPLAALE